MIIKIKRQDCLDKYPKFPQSKYDIIKDEEKYYSPKVFESYVLALDSKSLKGHSKILAIELSNLIKDLKVENLIFLGDTNNYWLTKLSLSHNDFKPLTEAIQYLMNNKIGKRFNGALKISNSELSVFIKHFFCLVLCDASLPHFHFMDAKQNFVGSICQYGNLHIETLNPKIDRIFKSILAKSKFTNLVDKKCYSPFLKTSTINVRRTSD